MLPNQALSMRWMELHALAKAGPRLCREKGFSVIRSVDTYALLLYASSLCPVCIVEVPDTLEAGQQEYSSIRVSSVY
jgi:hypothetical protein